MILLAHDCLFFELPNGDRVPLHSDHIIVEVRSGPAEGFDAEMVGHATAAVFHYFKHDLERLTVTVAEFSDALERVLRRLCLIWEQGASRAPGAEWAADLDSLAREVGGMELAFFAGLRKTLRHGLATKPGQIRFRGLRECVKRLVGTRRWTERCQAMHEQIVEFLRRSLQADVGESPCALLVE